MRAVTTIAVARRKTLTTSTSTRAECCETNPRQSCFETCFFSRADDFNALVWIVLILEMIRVLPTTPLEITFSWKIAKV